MRKRVWIVLFLAVLIFTWTRAQPARHVVLVTIDGFRPDFYLDPSWGAVNLRQLMEEGACAKGVRGIVPTVTFPSHTTLVTGVRPEKHGIYYNAPFRPDASSEDWYWYFESIKSPTLWEAAQQAGMTTGSVLWPVTAAAPIDYNIPDIWETGDTDRRRIIQRYAHPQGFWQEVQQQATGMLEANDFNLDKDYLSMDENVARIAAYIIRKYAPALVTVHLPAVDHAEHADGRAGRQVRRAVAGADRGVRTIVEAIDKAGIRDRTTVIITGDHGFGDRRTMFSPNVLLAGAGLITDVSTGNWKARFYSAGGSAFLYLKDKGDATSLAQVKKILATLPDSQKKFFSVVEGRELKTAGGDPDVMLALAGRQGTAFGNAVTGEVVKETKGGTHGYFPGFPGIETGFIVTGPGVRKGVVLPAIDMVEIAPFVARLLGVEWPAESTLYREIVSD
ncbi:MAG TPA: ectonucleotide pyrophosphatase/phosphodiesterase [Chryseosolibacter sp.]